MEITRLPFNSHVGISRSQSDSSNLTLSDESHLLNHVGTIHASALYALAEAASGEALLKASSDRKDIGGLLRRSTAKYSAPASGSIESRVTTPLTDLKDAIEIAATKGKALTDIQIQLLNDQDTQIASFTFTWLIAKQDS